MCSLLSPGQEWGHGCLQQLRCHGLGLGLGNFVGSPPQAMGRPLGWPLMALPTCCGLYQLTRCPALPFLPGNTAGESSSLPVAPKPVYNVHQGSTLVYENSTDSRSNLKPKNQCCCHCNLPSLCYCVPVCMYINLIINHNTNNSKMYTSFFNAVICYNYMISRRYLKWIKGCFLHIFCCKWTTELSIAVCKYHFKESWNIL